jgi:hypothetical protein
MKHGGLLFTLLVVVYLAITFLQPQDPEALARFGITAMQSRLLGLAIAIPLVGIWWLAYYGFSRFRTYANTIKDSDDGRAMLTLANGLGILAFSMPLQSVIGGALNWITRTHPDLVPASVILTNYINVGLSVAAFWVLWRGASALGAVTRIEPSWELRAGIALKIVAAGSAYAYLVLTNSIRQVPPESGRALYYVSDPLLILTIILPTIFTWYAGCRAAAWVWVYRKRVQGVVYRAAFGYLAVGIMAVVIASVAIQLMSAAWDDSLTSLALGPIIALVYGLLLMISVGFLLIAIGASKLGAIEQKAGHGEATGHGDLFRMAVAIVEGYLGPTAERFTAHQIRVCLNKGPERLTGDDIALLTECIEKAAAPVINSPVILEEMKQRLMALSSHHAEPAKD